MSDVATQEASQPAVETPTSMRTVVAASSAGTTFEWYDFFIFGTLTQILSKTFFAGVSDTLAFIFALAIFGAGFAVRPLGALVFGRIGDKAGRKGAFLTTIILMGGATFAVGFLPTYAQAGIISPILLIIARCVQGFALGGEYGGAAIYVAEHSDADKRGSMTGWIQASAAFGLLGALGVILITRTILGEEAFTAWGWRIPFMFSAVLVGISIWMRLKLSESPTFKKMHEEGSLSKSPYAESFGQWPNLKIVLIALLAMMSAQGAVWYTSFFYSQIFLEKFLKVEPATVNLLMIAATVASAPLYIIFGWLSDKIGRKPVMLAGMSLALIAFFPGFHMLMEAANPDLARASRNTPVVVVADPATCSLQFDPVGKAVFATPCDIAKSVLANAGVSYDSEPAPAGTLAHVKVGQTIVNSADGQGLDRAALKAVKTDVEGRIQAALKTAGYPAKADPAKVDLPKVFAILLVFVVAATALFGPIAACLVELFPTRIRYTAMSLPYHIGTGWIGGFLPFTAFAIVASTGNIYSGLWYPVIFTAISVVTAVLFLPETKGRSLDL